MPDIEIITPTEEQQSQFFRFRQRVDSIHCSFEEAIFLDLIIREYKPKKILEIGCGPGFYSNIILNSISNKQVYENDVPVLHSIDLRSNSKITPTLEPGHVVKNKKLKKQWHLYYPGFVLDYINEIGDDIDMVLLADNIQQIPGYIMDFLMVLPFLKKGAIFVTYNFSLSQILCANDKVKDLAIAPKILYSALNGKPILWHNSNNNIDKDAAFNPFNLAAKRLNYNIMMDVYNVFNLLWLRWDYKTHNNKDKQGIPWFKRKQEIIPFFKKYYNSYYSNLLIDIYKYQELIFETQE